jgi:hypothetical protein
MNFFGGLLNKTASDANREAQERFEKDKRDFIDNTKRIIDEKMTSKETKQKLETASKKGDYCMTVHKIENAVDVSYYKGREITKEEYDRQYKEQVNNHFTCLAWEEYVKEVNRKGNLSARLKFDKHIDSYTMVDTYYVSCKAWFSWKVSDNLLFKKDKMIGKILGS